MNKKIIKHRIGIAMTVVLFLIVVALILTVTIVGYQVTESMSRFAKNEKEVTEVSERLIKDFKASDDGYYTLSMPDKTVKLGLYDITDKKIKTEDLGSRYSDLFEKRWTGKNSKIQIDSFFSNNKSKWLYSVTYKKDFFFGKYTLWVYYGDRGAFPYCPNLAAYRYDAFGEDNLKRLTKNLYYAFAHY